LKLQRHNDEMAEKRKKEKSSGLTKQETGQVNTQGLGPPKSPKGLVVCGGGRRGKGKEELVIGFEKYKAMLHENLRESASHDAGKKRAGVLSHKAENNLATYSRSRRRELGLP